MGVERPRRWIKDPRERDGSRPFLVFFCFVNRCGQRRWRFEGLKTKDVRSHLILCAFILLLAGRGRERKWTLSTLPGGTGRRRRGAEGSGVQWLTRTQRPREEKTKCVSERSYRTWSPEKGRTNQPRVTASRRFERGLSGNGREGVGKGFGGVGRGTDDWGGPE